ncbi:MAG TPA: 3-oxo-5-alpha-steroid 4-dehydrogenase [Bacteroidales bacterium]|jgi:3-oxo-5-alpha-steroid 4-dehydrogenase 1|nr:3-oxo-5-alpha-steroid 4-dehydrogenase [Bacteroidales bacterium]
MNFILKVLQEDYNTVLISMSIIAVVVFIALFFVKAGYGQFRTKYWGLSLNNKLGWVLMELPVFILMLLLCISSERAILIPHIVFFLLFQLHYLQRALIFPFMIKGKSRMPITVILLGAIFNTVNAFMQGGWIFYVSPKNYYTPAWLLSPQFIVGTLLFFAGMIINMHSDHIIRNLRKPGDTKHYFPKGGMFKYVTSANYFGEFIEWVGFAILIWSWSGVVFALWTFANLAPRADAIRKSYMQKFPEEFENKKFKRMIPFIY